MEQTLGKYQIKEELGTGGFATVYLAENRMLGTAVALKILDPNMAKDEKFLQRFQAEARQAAMLNHPNIVRIIDFEEVNGRYFIAMDYVSGTDLQKHIQQHGLLPLDRIVEIIQQIGAALDYAHSKRLIHRDVKPSNILLSQEGVAKLTDFGIVRAAEGTRLTTSGGDDGHSPVYVARANKGTELDGRSDLYSLGVVAYELVTGKVPFTGETPVTVGYKHVQEPPAPPSTFNPRAGGALETILLKALAKETKDRYQTGAELGKSLATAVAELQENTLTTLYAKACQLQAERQFDAALQEMNKLSAMQPGYQDVAQRMLQIQASQQRETTYQELCEQWQTIRHRAAEILATEPDFPDEKEILPSISGQPQIAINNPPVPLASTHRDSLSLWRTSGLVFVLSNFRALGLFEMRTTEAINIHIIFPLQLLFDWPPISPTIWILLVYSLFLVLQWKLPKATGWTTAIRILLILSAGVLVTDDIYTKYIFMLIFPGLFCLFIAEIIQIRQYRRQSP